LLDQVLPELGAAKPSTNPIHASNRRRLPHRPREESAPTAAVGAWRGFDAPTCISERKARATILAERGATDRQLMAVFGWSSEKEATKYTKAANRKKLAATALPEQKADIECPTILSHREKSLSFRYLQMCWWAVRDSNPRHSACKADALPTELTARV
jgi:hypothetical protein